MITLVILLGILLLLILGFLFAPIVLYIDSDEQRLEVSQFPLTKIFFTFENYTVQPHVRFLGVDIPVKNKKSESPAATKKKTKKKSFKRSASAWRFLIYRVWKSFRVTRFDVDIDTDNVVTNAQLVPVFLLASRGPVQLNSNYQGRVYVHLEVTSLPARLLWIFLQFLTKK
jgi:hypothetical protein